MIYLDYNATSPLMPSVAAVMAEVASSPSNPSSIHALGRKARQQIEAARDVIANAISAFANEIIFMGSGTEANNTALRSVDRPILVSAIEHASVLKTALRLGADTLAVDAKGVVDLVKMESKLSALGRPALVSVMLVNNETGVIQPISKIAALAKRYDAIVHCDAVQAIGKIPVDFGLLGVDMMTLCAHKAGGPVGIGVLAVRQHLPIKPLLIGGGQELGRRAGTENVSVIMGFSQLLKSPDTDWMDSVAGWLRQMESEIVACSPEAIIVGADAQRLGNTSCILMPNVNSETQLMTFDLEGIALSAGSACTSGRIEVSHVLTAMGISSQRASCAIRVSAGWNTTENDILRFTEVWKKTYMRLSKNNA